MKNTRRFIAGFSAMAMAAAMAMSASAVDPTQIVSDDSGNPNPETAGAEVTYNVDPSYTVTIPAGADISSGSDVQSIKANDVLLEQGQKITVTLSGASNTASGKSFSAKDESGKSTVKYTIKVGDTNVAVGDKVAEFETKTGEQSATLTFTKDADSTPTFAGKHTETLTFNIAVEDSVEDALAPVLENGATMVVTYKWNRGWNTTTFTFTNNNGTYSCNVGGSSASDFSGSLTLNGTTLALSITNSHEPEINLAINFDTADDSYSFVTKDSFWYTSHTVSVNGTDITDQLTEKN